MSLIFGEHFQAKTSNCEKRETEEENKVPSSVNFHLFCFWTMRPPGMERIGTMSGKLALLLATDRRQGSWAVQCSGLHGHAD